MQTTKPPRGRNHKATSSDIEKAWRRIRDAADAGNLEASALLIALADKRPLIDAGAGLAA
ncbi:hypothetical protein SAMN05444503_1177 [Pseudomonas sp. BS3767]|uniref:hypothetical protein n=1 Tax=Pseudomonas TaxID=286 RepID=UPI00088692A2|nr:MULTISPECIES: hypothetical protein [Pseudomonas]RXU25525.1 hypothetical protein B0A92_10355 [Pseudomonas syringae]SDI56926.1 hypothetical protein SAMN05444503_1177 [Pseudomonas sp. BS3767]